MNISKHIRIPLLICALLLTTLWGVHTLRAEATGYTPVAINSPLNTSLKVTATPLELNNTTNLWSYKIDWKRTRNAQGSLSIAEESSPTTKVLSLSPASQEGSQTVTLKPSTTYRVKFYSTPGYGGTEILSRRLVTLSTDDEQPDVEASQTSYTGFSIRDVVSPIACTNSIPSTCTYGTSTPTNIQSRIAELLRIIEQLRFQISAMTPSVVGSTTPPTQPAVCTMEARLCPDGVTYVGRTGPQCEFAQCPPKKCDTGLLYMPSCAGVPVQNPNTCEITCQTTNNSSTVTITVNYTGSFPVGAYNNLTFRAYSPNTAANVNTAYTFKITGNIPGMVFEDMWCDRGASEKICPKMASLSSVMYFDGRPTQVGAYPITVTATDQYGNVGSKTLTIQVTESTSTRPPIIAACLYAAPPVGCRYIEGPNYNPQTTCGKVLSCVAETQCPNMETNGTRVCQTGYVSTLNVKTCTYECVSVGTDAQ